MWGGSYLIHSPWVLPTLLGDYFTADGERRGGETGEGDETCRLYIEHRRGPQNLYHGSLRSRDTRRTCFLCALSLVQILFKRTLNERDCQGRLTESTSGRGVGGPHVGDNTRRFRRNGA